ncbi:transposase [Streptomyces cellulosae]|uniref:Transposase n=1 Tax=Streptomyces cellulosae TaxID=1968 RepID=A0ABW7Y6Y9_STRCE
MVVERTRLRSPQRWVFSATRRVSSCCPAGLSTFAILTYCQVIARTGDLWPSVRPGGRREGSIGGEDVACWEGPADALVTGLIANTGRGTVTGMLLGANLTRHWSPDRAHSFFARARWEPQTLGASLSHLVVRSLVPDGTPLMVAVDDTLFKRRGKKVFGAAWQHDGSAAGRHGIGYGTCFVVLGLIVDLPFQPRPVCLPVAVRPHRPKGEQTKVELAASMIRFLAACHWSRRIDTQTVKVLLLREDATDTGYDLALISTDLTAPTGQLVARYVDGRSR